MTEEEYEKLKEEITSLNFVIDKKNKEIKDLRMKLFALYSKEREELLRRRMAV